MYYYKITLCDIAFKYYIKIEISNLYINNYKISSLYINNIQHVGLLGAIVDDDI